MTAHAYLDVIFMPATRSVDNDCIYFEQVQQSAAIDDGGLERIQSLMEMVSQVQHQSLLFHSSR